MTLPIVVNKYAEQCDVYIGRGSKFGNPYPINNIDDRVAVIDKYRSWLYHQIKQGNITVEDILSLQGKTLGCYCKPKACHGDVIVSAYKYYSNIK